jgi:hypothetical protein
MQTSFQYFKHTKNELRILLIDQLIKHADVKFFTNRKSLLIIDFHFGLQKRDLPFQEAQLRVEGCQPSGAAHVERV